MKTAKYFICLLFTPMVIANADYMNLYIEASSECKVYKSLNKTTSKIVKSMISSSSKNSCSVLIGKDSFSFPVQNCVFLDYISSSNNIPVACSVVVKPESVSLYSATDISKLSKFNTEAEKLTCIFSCYSERHVN